MRIQTYTSAQPFVLESGQQLATLSIAYHTYGQRNARKDNVIWVCHALTGNSEVFDWWAGLFGEDKLFNPEEYYIVCANVLGSAYGTTNPLSINPQTGEPYYLSFPEFTIRDIVAVNQLLAEHLEIETIHTLIGGSLGGQQALEWAAMKTIKIYKLIAIGTAALASPWAIAFNESQRLAIEADDSFRQCLRGGGMKGLKAARSMALLSYRNYYTYNATQRETDTTKTAHYKASSYQAYQGDKLVQRFNAYSYYYLTKAMDSHHLGRNRKSTEAALRSISAQTMVIGIPTDLLFPAEEQAYIALHIPNAVYYELHSPYGHDGFLIETSTLSNLIGNFLAANTHTALEPIAHKTI